MQFANTRMDPFRIMQVLEGAEIVMSSALIGPEDKVRALNALLDMLPPEQMQPDLHAVVKDSLEAAVEGLSRLKAKSQKAA